ncbi:hypothetical protein [Thalassovita taeanensis]|jgi:hypothetical protein|uniref:MerR family transcriptional regulator n=1 Tax=Thalassovita taeanensis TaxID=657014 RepID=A0A1H9FAE9_9RHOB|nr:hypothetical protein [Thalassovita taeanensis]SEQ34906.1 hypothetical protein SAMN04488092_10610 [Thalassovita taeanensis]
MTTQKLIGIVETAVAVGTTRAQIDNLRTLTQPRIEWRTDPKSKKRNKKLYNFDQMVAFLDHHLRLSDLQRERLDAASVEMLPSLLDRELVQ